MLEQFHPLGWRPVAYASRFLNQAERRYSTNELELLGVVWGLEHFKYYVVGKEFLVLTDHQALLSALRGNRGNKCYQSRLTRWVDRLLQFDFQLEHLPGSRMGLVDQLSRNPFGKAASLDEDDEKFVVAQICNQKELLQCKEFGKQKERLPVNHCENTRFLLAENKAVRISSINKWFESRSYKLATLDKSKRAERLCTQFKPIVILNSYSFSKFKKKTWNGR